MLGACEQEGCGTTHNEGTGGAEGKGPTGIEVSGIVRDQDTKEVETLCLERSREMRLSGQLPASWGLRGCPPPNPAFPVERRVEIKKLNRTWSPGMVAVHQGSVTRPLPPPVVTSLLFFLKAHSVFFFSVAGQGI